MPTAAAVMKRETTIEDIVAREGYEHAIGVVQGRGEPWHNGHAGPDGLIADALRRCMHVILMIGSSNKARDYKNPFTFGERKQMVEAVFADETARGRLVVVPMPDFFRNNAGWKRNVHAIVESERAKFEALYGVGIGDEHTALSGFKKDDTSFYLDEFPEWKDILLRTQKVILNATDVREAYFQKPSRILRDLVPKEVAVFLARFRRKAAFGRLVRERKNIDHCRKTWPGENHTADLLVTWRGQALMIRRGGDYGNGLIAFPGGIRDKGEDYVTCALREFAEEMDFFALNPGITEEFLKAHIVSETVNADKGRDLRGTYITSLIHVALPDSLPKPKVRPRDDAKKAFLIRIERIKEEETFADHFGMLHEALKLAA
jgi:bifunctional NMN adenylyltransferase/nudix hydrolase